MEVREMETKSLAELIQKDPILTKSTENQSEKPQRETPQDGNDVYLEFARKHWQKVYAKREAVQITSGQFLDFMCQKGKEKYPNFVVDKNNERAYRLLSQYFTRDPLFEEEGDSFAKGICLGGGVGTGKSAAFYLAHEAINAFHLRHLRVVHVLDIMKRFAKNGLESIDDWAGTYRKHSLYNSDDESQPIDLMIDDLGAETSPYNHFGSVTNVLADVLTARYNHLEKKIITHATTNLTNDGDEPENEVFRKYGYRTQDRFTQMFNYIALYGKSRRR